MRRRVVYVITEKGLAELAAMEKQRKPRAPRPAKYVHCTVEDPCRRKGCEDCNV